MIRSRPKRPQTDSVKRRPPQGAVYLVGAGPGDPDLLTIRARKLMRRADVALYDNLISLGILVLLPKRTERIYVGKRRADHAMRQEAINALLVACAHLRPKHSLALSKEKENELKSGSRWYSTGNEIGH